LTQAIAAGIVLVFLLFLVGVFALGMKYAARGAELDDVKAQNEWLKKAQEAMKRAVQDDEETRKKLEAIERCTSVDDLNRMYSQAIGLLPPHDS